MNAPGAITASTPAAACANTSCACSAPDDAAAKTMAGFFGRLLTVFGVVIVAVIARALKELT